MTADATTMGPGARARDLLALTKPRLSSLVLFTTAGGMALSGVALPWWTWGLVLLATWGVVGGANALNQWRERESDRFMARTRERPLPSGRMEPRVALVFGLVLSVVSVPLLAVVANVLSAALGLLALLSYVLVYTPLKKRTGWAMVAGALPGALPPLMGWTAATNAISAGGLALFGILFVWQLPHTLSIALFRKDEYQAAGLTSVPLQYGDAAARWWAVGLSGLLVAASAGPWAAGVVGLGYLVVALAASGGFLALAVVGAVRALGRDWARRLFVASLVYLVTVFFALGLG